MRLMAWVDKFNVTLLEDSSSTHNFVNASIVSKIRLKPTLIQPFELKVASGKKLKCEALIKALDYNRLTCAAIGRPKPCIGECLA